MNGLEQKYQRTGYINSEYPIAQALVDRYSDTNKPPYWKKDDIINATKKAKKASDRIMEFIIGS